MATRPSLPLLLAIAASCTCGPPPEQAAPAQQATTRAPVAPAEAPRAPGLRGRVVLPAREVARIPPAAEIRVVPESAMVEFVSARLQAARTALGRLTDARERATQEASAALAVTDRTDQEWKATTANDLQRRVEVILRRPRDPAEVRAVHGELIARKKASYARAVKAADRSREKELAVAELEREARRFRDARYFSEGLPPAVRATRTDASGDFEMDVPPGRYALVALLDAQPGDTRETVGWLLWVEVREGAPGFLLLDEHNRHGTDCDACVVSVKDLP